MFMCCLLQGLGVATYDDDVDVHELGSGRRPLGHNFHWQGPEDNNETDLRPSSCRNSVQGKALIADDKGTSSKQLL